VKVARPEPIGVTPADHFHFHRPYKTHRFYHPLCRFACMSDRETIEIDDKTDRWRYVCPRGHRTWEPTNNHFWCQQCARVAGVEPAFDQLQDRRDGRLLDRDEVRLLTPVGPYDRDLDYREWPA
jgi:hypothetical protein